MSFAEPWVRYLKDSNHLILSIACIEDFKGREFNHYFRPDEFLENRKPECDEVAVETNGVMRFTIGKDKTMKLRHMFTSSDLSSEKEEEYYRKARELGYNVTEFNQTDV